jgi:hypothetical protein
MKQPQLGSLGIALTRPLALLWTSRAAAQESDIDRARALDQQVIRADYL